MSRVDKLQIVATNIKWNTETKLTGVTTACVGFFTPVSINSQLHVHHQ